MGACRNPNSADPSAIAASLACVPFCPPSLSSVTDSPSSQGVRGWSSSLAPAWEGERGKQDRPVPRGHTALPSRGPGSSPTVKADLSRW